MAIIPLTDTRSCANFFYEGVLLNLRFWQDRDAIKTMDIQILDREQAGIIRAILFAFDLDEAWSAVHELIIALSPYMERRGYWEMWRWVLNRAIEVAQRVEDMAGAVTLSLLLARLLQRQSDFRLAINQYRQTIRLAAQIGDQYTKARACSNLGFLYSELGHWWRAEIVCCHALAVFERLNSNHGRAHTENHLGILYIWQRRWDLARQHLEQACVIWQEMGDDHGLLYGLSNLASMYDDMECPDQALSYLEKALPLAQLTGEEVQVANIYLNMGIAFRLKCEFDKAEAYIWQAEAIYRRFSNLIGLAQVHVNLGIVCLAEQKWPGAKSHLKSALQIWSNLRNEYGKITVLIYLVEYELARRNLRKAARQLAVVERIINLSNQNRHTPYWQSLLAKCRRSLIEYSAR